jgi:putative transposase
MRPAREQFRNNDAAYFVSTQTAARKPFFRHELWARLMLNVLNHYDGSGYKLHAFVIMPDHLHLLITPSASLEKSVQLLKGGFSFRAKRELGWKFDIWQQGFTDHRIRDEADWQRPLDYIRTTPVDAKLVSDAILYEFAGFPDSAFPQGLKPVEFGSVDVRAKARTLHSDDSVRAKTRTLHLDASVRAKARTLHSDASVRAKTRTLHSDRIPGTAEAAPLQNNSDINARPKAGSLQNSSHKT